jgi:hypothetical protein
VLGVLYCAPCAERPEVNYLEALRRKLWGRRDGNAWGALFWCALFVLLAVYGVSDQSWPLGLVSLGCAGICTGLFLGQPWSRPALFVLPVALGCVAGLYAGPLPALLTFVFGFPYLYSVHQDARTRLFLRLPVSEAELRAIWERTENNPLAQRAVALGLFSLFLPVLAPVAIGCGVVALRRVDPHAQPPVGRRGSALLGIIAAVFALGVWLYSFLPRLGLLLRGMLGD